MPAPSSCSAWASLDRRRAPAEAGLVNAVVPAAELEAKALNAAKRLAAKPRAALLAARRMLKADPALIARPSPTRWPSTAS